MTVAEREQVATLRLPSLHAAQLQIKREALRFNVAVCGRRFGKSVLGIDVLLEPALRGLPVAWFAPHYKLLTPSWRDVKTIVAPITAHTDTQQHRLELTTGGVIEFWSLDTPGVSRGRRYARVVIDEAAQDKALEEHWQEIIRPTLTDYKGDGWFLGTPQGFDYFHTLFERGRNPQAIGYRSWQMPSWANPLLDRAEIESARNDMPEVVFNQEYGASFLDDAHAIFDRAWWRGKNRYDAGDPTLARECLGRWLSFDTALKDKDDSAYTACTVGELTPDYKLLIRQVWRDRLQFPDLPNQIEAMARRYNQDLKLRGVLIEDKASGTSAYQTLMASAEPWLTELLVAFQPQGDKPQRAGQAGVWCRNDCVLLPEPSADAIWLSTFEDELFAVPASRFWDQIDSFDQLVLYLEHYLSEGWHARNGRAA